MKLEEPTAKRDSPARQEMDQQMELINKQFLEQPQDTQSTQTDRINRNLKLNRGYTM